MDVLKVLEIFGVWTDILEQIVSDGAVLVLDIFSWCRIDYRNLCLNRPTKVEEDTSSYIYIRQSNSTIIVESTDAAQRCELRTKFQCE